MSQLTWIIAGSAIMSAVAMVGSVSLVLPPAALRAALLPLVSLAAGSLLGGALFHMLPEGLAQLDPLSAGAWLAAGFASFLALEQAFHWHHAHFGRPQAAQPVTYLILLGDGAHHFLGGLAIASTFLMDLRAGIIAWFAALAHELPQELGDFGVLVHGGWPPGRALLWNFISGLTFPLGALVAYAAAQRFDVAALVAFGAGNFLYIAAADLVPEMKAHPRALVVAGRFAAFALGLVLMYLLARLFRGGP